MSSPSLALHRSIRAAEIFAGSMVLFVAVALLEVRPWHRDRPSQVTVGVADRPSPTPPVPNVPAVHLATPPAAQAPTVRSAPPPAVHRSVPAPVRIPSPASAIINVHRASPPPAPPAAARQAGTPAPQSATSAAAQQAAPLSVPQDTTRTPSQEAATPASIPGALATPSPAARRVAAEPPSLSPLLVVPEENLTGASPVDQEEIRANLAAVRGLQAHLGKPVREFHVHEGYQTQLFPGLGCMLTRFDGKHGRFTLVLLRKEGTKQTVKSDLTTPVSFLGEDGMPHQLVVRRLVAGQAYGYLIP